MKEKTTLLNVSPNTIARKYGIELKGTPAIYRDGRTIKATWYTREGESFTFYSKGHWDIERDNGDYIAGHTTLPTQKSWMNRSAKLY